MLYKFFQGIDKRFSIQPVSAHCDIPCKIYDPITAQLAALSVIRFFDLIKEIKSKPAPLSFSDNAQLIRLINEKETHAAKVKDEVRIIWGDFFKEPQLAKYPETHQLVHNIMLAASACKQHAISLDEGETDSEKDLGLKLLELVNEFAESFWKSRGTDTYRAVCPYLPEKDLVYPQLVPVQPTRSRSSTIS